MTSEKKPLIRSDGLRQSLVRSDGRRQSLSTACTDIASHWNETQVLESNRRKADSVHNEGHGFEGSTNRRSQSRFISTCEPLTLGRLSEANPALFPLMNRSLWDDPAKPILLKRKIDFSRSGPGSRMHNPAENAIFIKGF